VTTVREELYARFGTDLGYVLHALGIDPDLDLGKFRLVVVPKCETCGGKGQGEPLWSGSTVGYIVDVCPTCRGTGDAGVPVVLPAEIAEHLPALLRLAARATLGEWRQEIGEAAWEPVVEAVLRLRRLEANP
jgi:hypothetical protein